MTSATIRNLRTLRKFQEKSSIHRFTQIFTDAYAPPQDLCTIHQNLCTRQVKDFRGKRPHTFPRFPQIEKCASCNL